MAAYAWTLEGTAADGQSWATSGTLYDEPGNFPAVVSAAMRASFIQLTQGKAVYGKPGLACNGPYTMKRLVVEAEEGL